MNDRVVKNPNFKNNGEFHRSLAARPAGTKDWPNSHTEVEHLGNGKFAASIGIGHRVFFDKADENKPKKHKPTDERPGKDYVLVQSAKCCVEVYPYYAKYFDVQHEEVRLHEERWVVQRLFKEPDEWRDVDAYNPQIAVEEYPEPAGDVVKVTVTYDTDYGTLTVEYFQRDGNALKYNVTFRNTSGSIETFRVLQRWAGIVGAKCNGKDFPMVVDEPFLAFRKADGKLTIAENLRSMMFHPDGSEKTEKCLQRPIRIESHAQGMKADFIYGNWVLLQDESLGIDPDTAILDDPYLDGSVEHHDATYNLLFGEAYLKMGLVSEFCVTSETLVLMADNTRKPIKDIEVGDRIMSFDTHEDRVCVSQVLASSNHVASQFVVINGVLKATSHHLIWTSKGLKTVGELEIGDYLLNINNKKVAVETIRMVEAKMVVYELGLSKPHTYYADGFLVHNYDIFYRGFVEWDVSGIPDGATITDTVFKYNGDTHGIDCHIHEMLEARPFSAGATAVYNSAGEGTIYADPAGFPEVGTGKQADLGASADSDLQSQLALDWFAIGIQSDNEGSYATSRIYSKEKTDAADPKPTLYVEYSVGWSGKISGVTNPAKVMGVDVANIAKVKGVASA